MKKLFILLLAFSMTGLAACSGNADKTVMQTVGGGATTGGMQAAAQGSSANQIFGKVISVVGNEIELKVGTMPELDLGDEEEDFIVQEIEGGGVAIAKRVDTADEGGMELDYTGDTIKVTISAGVPIMSMGQESTLSTIKTGSILALSVDDSTSEVLNINNVEIIS